MLPASKKISDKAAEFIDAIINGKNQSQAAKQAGYASPAQAGYMLMKSPGIVAKIQQERQKLFQTDLANVATATLKEIILDKDAPQSARIAGCRTVLEVCNMIGKHSTKDNDNRALSEMSPQQLAGLISTLENTKAAMATPVQQD
jgi:phage terminase small subunit